MAKFIDVEEIAGLVSGVTDTMCGTTFAPWDPMARGESLSVRMFLLKMEGPRRIRVALACDSTGSRALAAAMFHCAPGDVTARQIDDAIAELLNVVAGQVQRRLKIDQPLGITRPTNLGELTQEGGVGIADAVLLRSQGAVDIRLWIFEQSDADAGASKAQPAGGTPRPARSFRSLIKRFTART